ncbi:hypothetical protein H5T87_04265 [bacterium]|nr:hypothetical protein [bacterium]
MQNSLKKLFLVTFSLALLKIAPAADVKLSGYTKMRYVWNQTADPESQFTLQDLRLKNTVKVSDIATLVAEGNFTSTVSTTDAYIQLKLGNNGQALKFGQAKIPFGYEMPLSGAFLETPSIATVLQKLFPNQTYDQGIFYYPNKFLSIALVNGTGRNTKDNNNQKDLIIHFADKKDKLSYGASLYVGKQRASTKDVTKNRSGIDLLWNCGKSVLRGEAIWGKDQDETSKGWFIQWRYNADKTSYIMRYEYYNGVDKYDTKKGWIKTEEKAFLFGPMFYLDKNTILSAIYTAAKGSGNDNFMLQLEVIY